MDTDILNAATAIKGVPEHGVHLVHDGKGDWVLILITTGERINSIKNISKHDYKTDKWYWANENTPTEFMGPFNNSIEAVTNCVHTLQGNDKFIFERDSGSCVKCMSSTDDLVVETGIHGVERRDGTVVKVAIVHSDDAPENNLPDGYYWSAEYAKDKATGPHPSAKDALLDAVRIIQEWKEGDVAILNVHIHSRIPAGVTLH
jgi:hypothetical protein